MTRNRCFCRNPADNPNPLVASTASFQIAARAGCSYRPASELLQPALHWNPSKRLPQLLLRQWPGLQIMHTEWSGWNQALQTCWAKFRLTLKSNQGGSRDYDTWLLITQVRRRYDPVSAGSYFASLRLASDVQTVCRADFRDKKTGASFRHHCSQCFVPEIALDVYAQFLPRFKLT